MKKKERKSWLEVTLNIVSWGMLIALASIVIYSIYSINF